MQQGKNESLPSQQYMSDTPADIFEISKSSKQTLINTIQNRQIRNPEEIGFILHPIHTTQTYLLPLPISLLTRIEIIEHFAFLLSSKSNIPALTFPNIKDPNSRFIYSYSSCIQHHLLLFCCNPMSNHLLTNFNYNKIIIKERRFFLSPKEKKSFQQQMYKVQSGRILKKFIDKNVQETQCTFYIQGH